MPGPQAHRRPHCPTVPELAVPAFPGLPAVQVALSAHPSLTPQV
jgi:hypothetical protein